MRSAYLFLMTVSYVLVAILASAAGSDGEWLPGEGLPGTNDTVRALAIYDDGSGPALYAGGTFSIAGTAFVGHVARWDGSAWQPLGSGIAGGYSSYVNALIAYQGELIVGGGFTIAGGEPCANIARWNGSVWQPLGVGVDDGVYALAIYSGDLIAAGDFTSAGGIPAARIARWDGIQWLPLGTGMNFYVDALTVHGGRLIAGGSFTLAGGQSANRVASWDGTQWAPLGNGLNAQVQALAVYDGELIAGGDFEVGDEHSRCVARWDGAAWVPLGSGMSGGNPYYQPFVLSLTVFDGTLIAGGSFTYAGGTRAECVARWDGAQWSPLGSGIPEDDSYPWVAALVVDGGGLIAGGSFRDAGEVRAFYVSRWDGDAWGAIGSGTDDRVEALSSFHGQRIVAGPFNRIGGVSGRHIASWDGTQWSPLGSGMDDRIFALAVYQGELVAGGWFSTAGDVTVNQIARWDGTSWRALGTGMSAGSGRPGVEALAVYHGELIAGGYFNQAGDVAVHNIARWNGSSWAPLDSGLGGEVSALTVYQDQLIAGGAFTYAGGQSASHIARWDGSAWSPLGSGLAGDFVFVFALAVYQGRLIAAGEFELAGGQSAANIACWDGTEWSPLGSGLGGFPFALTVYQDELIAGGVFTDAGGVSVNYIARWDGLGWAPLGNGLNFSDHALHVCDHELIAGGSFTVAGEHVSAFLARWSAPQVPLLLTGPGPSVANPPLVRLLDAADPSAPLTEWAAYGVDEFGVNVAAGDLNRDGLAEVITGPGPGAVFGPHVRAFDLDGDPVSGVSFLAYGTHKFGVNVTAGDLDGDGYAEIVTGAGPGAVFGPHVRGWDVDGGTAAAIPGVSFLAYGTHKFGVNVACGDLDGDGYEEIVTGAGPGAVFGPHVRGWNVDGGAAAAIPGVSFLAYGTHKFGVNVACGDLDGDGFAEILTGPGPGGMFGAQVRGWNYDGAAVTPLAGVNFVAYGAAHFGAVVAAADLDGDGFDETLTMPGPDPAQPARVRGWNVDGGTVTPIATIDFDAYEDLGLLRGGRIAGGGS